MLESKHFVSVQYYERVMSHGYSSSKCVDAGKLRKSQFFFSKGKESIEKLLGFKQTHVLSNAHADNGRVVSISLICLPGGETEVF